MYILIIIPNLPTKIVNLIYKKNAYEIRLQPAITNDYFILIVITIQNLIFFIIRIPTIKKFSYVVSNIFFKNNIILVSLKYLI